MVLRSVCIKQSPPQAEAQEQDGRQEEGGERRRQRLASETAADNRISYGCINVPVNFYEQVLLPAARAGAVIYVLPEVRRLSDVFGAGVDRMPAPQASDRPLDDLTVQPQQVGPLEGLPGA